MSLEAEGLVEVVQTTRLLNYFCVSGVVMLIADYIHTLPEEVRLIWPTARSIPKFLFLVVRYGNFVFCIVTSIYTLSPLPTLKECKGLSLTLLGLEVFLTSVGEGIMYFRVWAFSGADRQILYLLSSVYLVIVTAAWALMIKWFAQGTDGEFLPQPLREDMNTDCEFGHHVSSTNGIVANDTRLVLRATRQELAQTVCRASAWGFGCEPYVLGGIDSDSRIDADLEFSHQYFEYTALRASETRICLQLRQVAVHGVIVTRVILQLRKYSEKNQAHAMETASGSGQNESVMVGFVVTDHSDQSIPPMQFASHTERAVRPIQAPPAT
ncbi:hypothetical protein NMY22_g10386 [Coprinellus aureogranulatus]|nr:hypothetical protein NMY22_g10386 [Coprinellus aureogranulatus]